MCVKKTKNEILEIAPGTNKRGRLFASPEFLVTSMDEQAVLLYT